MNVLKVVIRLGPAQTATPACTKINVLGMQMRSRLPSMVITPHQIRKICQVAMCHILRWTIRDIFIHTTPFMKNQQNSEFPYTGNFIH